MLHRRTLLFISCLGALVVASCLQSASAPSLSPSAASPVPIVASPSAPSPSPTIASPSVSPSASTTPLLTPAANRYSPKPVPATRPSDLVVRLEASGDVCCPAAVAVLTADGRLVTRADDGQLFERRLTAAGVQRVRDELVGTGLFERDQRFGLEVLPGANPPGRGIGGLSFRVWRDTRPVEVHTVMHMGADEVYFVPSAARTRLDHLWKQLVRPETWLPPNAWADSTPRPYEPTAFTLLLRTEIGQANERPMIDAIKATWPFSVGPFDLGQSLPETAGPLADMTRCSVLTRDDMVAVTNAIVVASGGDSPFTSTDGTVVTSFAAADNQARLVVILRPLLPDRGSCSGESSW